MKPVGLNGRIVYEKSVDTGGMFNYYEGVVKTPTEKYRAYITTGFNGGWAGKHLDTVEDASRDLERGRGLCGYQ